MSSESSSKYGNNSCKFSWKCGTTYLDVGIVFKCHCLQLGTEAIPSSHLCEIAHRFPTFLEESESPVILSFVGCKLYCTMGTDNFENATNKRVPSFSTPFGTYTGGALILQTTSYHSCRIRQEYHIPGSHLLSFD